MFTIENKIFFLKPKLFFGTNLKELVKLIDSEFVEKKSSMILRQFLFG